MAEPVTTAVAASTVAATASTGFFAGVFGFIAGVIFSVPALIVLAVLGILFEHNGARGWAVFTAILSAFAAYFVFMVPFATIAIGAGVYFVVGLLWSVWRYKRHADQVVEKLKGASQDEKEHYLARLHPKEMIGTITAWILIWPFSLIGNLVGDLITVVQNLVQKFFRGIYHRIYDSAVSSLTK
jgi:hypothetical protein